MAEINAPTAPNVNPRQSAHPPHQPHNGPPGGGKVFKTNVEQRQRWQ